MAISLSELTGASTSGNVLNEVNSYADFLDSVPRLVNKADPTGNTDAVQTVATKQPVALPLIDGDGYLFCPGINGNYAQTPDDDSLDFAGDLVIDVDVTMKSWSPTYNSSFCGKYLSTGDQRSFRFLLRPDKRLQVYFSDDGTAAGLSGVAFSTEVPFSDNQRGQIRFSFNSSNGIAQFFTSTDKGVTWTQLGPDRSTGKTSIHSGTADLYIGAYYTNSELLENAAIHSVKFYDSVTPSSNSLRFNCDFNSSKIPHGASKFLSDSGHQVRVLTSGNNPSKVIKKPVLRFDGVDDWLQGLLGQTVTDGYVFAAYSVLGDGGENYARVSSLNSTGETDTSTGYVVLATRGGVVPDTVTRSIINGIGQLNHSNTFSDSLGDVLFELKFEADSAFSKINNANTQSVSGSSTVDAEEFNIASNASGNNSGAIDLEYLALFPASLSDSQADQIRNFINRNKVFTLIDSQGYYFFDGAATDDGQVLSSSTPWNGRIVGSDNGDADFYIYQDTLDDRPTTDGYKITFADNTDHFDTPQITLAAGDTHAWMVCGTSLGTFAYKVTVSGETELNLLGHLGDATYRKAGDLYGIILLPQNATNRDIEEARRVLINRGASDGVNGTTLESFFRDRQDIINFNYIDTSNVTEMWACFLGCSNIVSYPLFDTSSVTSMGFAFQANNYLTSFPAIQAPLCSNFQNTWQSCSSLTQFPSGAKLGTEASNVNFTSAWRSAGLTSFSTELPSATNVSQAWRDCSALTSFNVASLSAATDVSQAWRNCSSLTSFSTELPLAPSLAYTWQGCSSLTDFSADVFANWNPSGLNSTVFNNAWDGCTSLTAQSVENILVGISNSNKWPTYNGTSGGTALTDATIDIDYNVATGSLTAATLSAIETLNGRGWSVNINGVIQ